MVDWPALTDFTYWLWAALGAVTTIIIAANVPWLFCRDSGARWLWVGVVLVTVATAGNKLWFGIARMHGLPESMLNHHAVTAISLCAVVGFMFLLHQIEGRVVALSALFFAAAAALVVSAAPH